MENLKLLIQKIKTNLAKAQVRFEKAKRLKDTNDEKYNIFRHGQAWGEIRAYNAVLGLIGICKQEKEEEVNEDEED